MSQRGRLNTVVANGAAWRGATLRKRTRKIPLAQHATRYYAHVTLHIRTAYVARCVPVVVFTAISLNRSLRSRKSLFRGRVLTGHAEIAFGTRTADACTRPISNDYTFKVPRRDKLFVKWKYFYKIVYDFLILNVKNF